VELLYLQEDRVQLLEIMVVHLFFQQLHQQVVDVEQVETTIVLILYFKQGQVDQVEVMVEM
jgi:IS4 transposase